LTIRNEIMEKLVLRYHWCDPYVAEGDVIIPFEYESKEQAFVDFMELRENTDWEFRFLGERFEVDDTEDVEFFTLEEWFEKYKLKTRLH